MADTEEMQEIIEKLKKDVAAAEENARASEDRMMQAARYGKDLLERNLELETNLETDKQEKHELTLRLQAKLELERSLTSELEALRESLKEEERKVTKLKEEEGERNTAREDELRMRLHEQELEGDSLKSKESALQELVVTLQRQVEEANSALNRSVHGESFTSEFESVQQENVSLLKEKQSLEVELCRARDELDTTNSNLTLVQEKVSSLVQEVEGLQCERSGYLNTIESLKMEITDLEAQLDAERDGRVDEDGKGNSLFSEVEDRRQKVEDQLANLTTRYDKMKETYDFRLSELQKVKMHNSQLLGIVGTRNDGEHVNRLEELLSAEKEKVRVLLEKMETLDRLGTGSLPGGSAGLPVAADQPAVAAEERGNVSLMDTDTSGVEVPAELRSSEYQYLSHLLQQAGQKNSQLEQEMRKQVRAQIEESDKQRDLCRKLHNSEQQINKLKADNYNLKIQIEEVKANNEKSIKKEPKKRKIVEKIDFSTPEEKENAGDNSAAEFIVKETVVKQGSIKEGKPAENILKEGNGPDLEKPAAEGATKRRRGVMVCDRVEEIDVDGAVAETTLVDQQKEKLQKATKPRGGRKKIGEGEVKKAEVAEECKTQ